MKNMKRIFAYVYFTFFACLMATKTAQAYIDPATTSYMLQIVGGLFIAVGATVAVFWRKIVFWFKKKKAMRMRKKKEQNGK